MFMHSAPRIEEYLTVFFFASVRSKLTLIGKGWVSGLIAVFYPTPVELGAMSDLGGVGKESVDVAAVSTIELVAKTKIREFFAVKVNKVSQADSFYAV